MEGAEFENSFHCLNFPGVGGTNLTHFIRHEKLQFQSSSPFQNLRHDFVRTIPVKRKISHIKFAEGPKYFDPYNHIKDIEGNVSCLTTTKKGQKAVFYNLAN